MAFILGRSSSMEGPSRQELAQAAIRRMGLSPITHKNVAPEPGPWLRSGFGNPHNAGPRHQGERERARRCRQMDRGQVYNYVPASQRASLMAAHG